MVFFVFLFDVGWYGVDLMWCILFFFKNVLNFLDINWGLLLEIIFIGSLYEENRYFKVLIVFFEVVEVIIIILIYFEYVFIIIRNMCCIKGLV